MKNKNKKNLKGGFAPLLIIAIIAILAIGGGAYVLIKNNGSKDNFIKNEDNLNTEANVNADARANANANLGVNAKGSLRSLLALGKSTMCTFTSTAGETNSSGTVYISADGSMRGDFSSKTSANPDMYSSMIVTHGTSYMWSGSQGVKMSATSKSSADASANANAKSKVDLDSQVDYKCSNWTTDESKFVLPASVKFVDLDAMLKGSGLPGGVDINAMMNARGY